MQKTLAQPKKRPSFLRQHYQEIVTISLLAVDIFSIVISFFIAYRLRLIIPLPEPAQGVPGFATFLPLLGVQIVSIITAFFLSKMYHRRRARYGSDDLAAIFTGVSIGTLISIAVASLTFKGDLASMDYPRVMVIYAWILTIVIDMAMRGLQARIQRSLQVRGVGRTRVVVVGSGEPAATVLQRLVQTPRLGYDVVGLVPFDGAAPLVRGARARHG